MQRWEKGFTLIEMLIVIGLLAIVTTVAIPRFKKCYDDIRISKSIDDGDSLLQSMRAYYLIMNELPRDENEKEIPENITWSIQANFMGMQTTSSLTGNNKIFYYTIQPWQGIGYDWEVWPELTNYHAGIAIRINLSAKNTYLNKLNKRYNLYYSEKARYPQHDLMLWMVEYPKTRKSGENRYF